MRLDVTACVILALVQAWHVWTLRRALARVRAREALVVAVHARVNRLEWALARLLSRQLRRALRRCPAP